MRRNSSLVATALMTALAQGIPALGQQTSIVTRPGSGITRTSGGHKSKPERTPEQIARHAAKLRRRYLNWTCGIWDNPCLSRDQCFRLLGEPDPLKDRRLDVFFP
jgi:hypothetical protein